VRGRFNRRLLRWRVGNMLLVTEILEAAAAKGSP